MFPCGSMLMYTHVTCIAGRLVMWESDYDGKVLDMSIVVRRMQLVRKYICMCNHIYIDRAYIYICACFIERHKA